MSEVDIDPSNLAIVEKALVSIAERPRRDHESAFPDMGTVLLEMKKAKLGVPEGMSLEEFEQMRGNDAFTAIMGILKNRGIAAAFADQPNFFTPLVETAILALGGTRYEGLKRFNEAQPNEIPHLKREFIQAYIRAWRSA